ncbi:MAG: hypothetical protein HY943_19170 [Gammaproteobacteria bacterium]|nr:hypothetical protein [Gammaproteobacteria bacterium]
MRDIDERLAAWKQSQCTELPVAGMYSRNPTAHKWKAPFRSWCLRECVSWRAQDLLTQSLLLHDAGQQLGARILLRSALETIAVLIYLNQMTRRVLENQLNFHEFSEKTSVLLLGSRDETTSHKSMSIVSILERCDRRYPGILDLYARLSESAHPNYEGTSVGYSDIDTEEHVVSFKNKWSAMYGDRHIGSLQGCYELFFAEYNTEWSDAMEALEAWIEQNDAILEATKRGA